MTRLPLAALIGATIATAASAQSVIETEQMVVYDAQWVQSKLPDQKGALMFLTVPRGQKGEYFSISCAGTQAAPERTVKLGYPQSLGGETVKVTLAVDGKSQTATAKFTGTTLDQAYTKADIHGYELSFANEAEEKAFFDAMRAGTALEISGQTMPVSLIGFSAAFQGQSKYCR